jgi:hypothetical protein
MMNKRISQLMLTLVAVASCLSLVSLRTVNSEIKNFPLIMWSHKSEQLTQEFDTSVKFEGVIEAIKNEANATQAELVVLIVKE